MRRVPRIPYLERRLLNRILGRIGGEESCEHPGNSRSVNSLTRKSSLRAATETPGRVTLVAIKAHIQLSYTFPEKLEGFNYKTETRGPIVFIVTFVGRQLRGNVAPYRCRFDGKRK